MRVRLRPACATVALAVAAFGCGDGRVPVYPVTGSILVKGKPADGAFLVFHPTDGAAKDVPRPYATAEPDGTFRLTTYSSADGAPSGTYLVTVVWRPRPKSTVEAEGPDKLSGRYGDAAASKLEVTVGKAAMALEPFRLD